MPRPRTNPFTVLLGIVGIAFTLTAASYCVSVLRGVRPSARASTHTFDTLMSGHGTAILAGELVLLAISTAGSIAMDTWLGRRALRDVSAAGRGTLPRAEGEGGDGGP